MLKWSEQKYNIPAGGGTDLTNLHRCSSGFWSWPSSVLYLHPSLCAAWFAHIGSLTTSMLMTVSSSFLFLRLTSLCQLVSLPHKSRPQGPVCAGFPDILIWFIKALVHSWHIHGSGVRRLCWKTSRIALSAHPCLRPPLGWKKNIFSWTSPCSLSWHSLH